MAHDQRGTDAFSLVYDSEPLGEDTEILGLPRAILQVASSATRANWFVRLSDVAPDGTVTHFAWVTDIPIEENNLMTLMRGARARWKIENETFNTLKNQGYHFEHNFGHGRQNLSVVVAMLMMLAFLVDQVQQLCCPLFRAVWKKLKTKRALWDNLRSHFRHFTFTSMQHIYEVILHDLAKDFSIIQTWGTCINL